MLLERRDIDALVSNLDVLVGDIQKYADTHNIDVDHDDEYIKLCSDITDFESCDTASPEAAIILFERVYAWKKHHVRHDWILQSKYSGEIFTLIGEIGDLTAYDAMGKQGLDSTVWTVIAELN